MADQLIQRAQEVEAALSAASLSEQEAQHYAEAIGKLAGEIRDLREAVAPSANGAG